METKFLSDGRKVSVVGKINSTEFIVQEIFVTDDGSEIPSGENFTCKSLHDSPVMSYKDKQVAALQTQLDRLDAQIKEQEQKHKRILADNVAASEMLKRTNFLSESLPEFDWEYFCDVISGNMLYAVCEHYGRLEVKDFSKVVHDEESGYGIKHEGIKAFSLSRNWDGQSKKYSLTYRISRYPDGSGGSTDYKFFKSLKDLAEYLNEYMTNKSADGSLTSGDIKTLSEYIPIPKEIKEQVVNREMDNHLKHFDYLLENANKYLEESKKNLEDM